MQALDNEYALKGFTPGPVYSDHLKVIIDAFSTDESLKKVVGELRGVEVNIRNLAAHELESFTEQKILDMTVSGGELTAEVTADYLRREHLPDRAFSSEKARYYQPAGTMP